MNPDTLMIIGIYLMIGMSILTLITGLFMIGNQPGKYTAGKYIVSAFFCILDIVICVSYLKTF